MEQGNRKRIATVKHPTIEAVLNAMFRFERAEQAIARMNAVRDFFVISKDQPTNEAAVRLWIKGFSITEDEEKTGFLGNFAVIRPRKVGEGKFTLYAEKETIPLHLHPQKKRPRRKHPDWGHPVLRSIKKRMIFKSVEEAQALLLTLHEEYPDVSIPTTGKLYIIVYTRTAQPPVQKFVLEIQVAPEGGFLIECRANTYQHTPRAAPASAENEGKKEDEANKGYFASMVELKRSKKRKKEPVRKGGKTADDLKKVTASRKKKADAPAEEAPKE